MFGEGKMTMETEAVKQINSENLKKNRIQVSNTKKPLFFYVNLAKVCTCSLGIRVSSSSSTTK